MRRSRSTTALSFFLLLVSTLSFAQHAQLTGRTMLVLPFENTSKAPGIEWIGEAFPEVLQRRISSLYVIPREDLAYAFDRLGISANLRPSRATLYRMAQEMDANYVVLGSYNFDGRTFTATAQVLDMGWLRLTPAVFEGGPLTNLLDVVNAIAWDVLRAIAPGTVMARNDFLAASPAVRLDAFENYIRGTSAGSRPEKIRRLREALRLNPAYTQAMLQLGKTYYDARDYANATAWLERIPKTESQANEANFYLGLACYYTGDFKRAQEAFRWVAGRLPLTEVYNNLGVVAARRGERTAVEAFEKAVQADPNDPDYHFNLAVALLRFGDPAVAGRQLKEALALRPGDGEARALLASVTSGAAAAGTTSPGATTASTPRLPLERIKRNYDESQFRQLAMEIDSRNELRMASQPPRVHAGFHSERGRDMLRQGFLGEAEKEFREAIALDPTLAAAHSGLATALESRDPATARSEAQAAIRLEPSAEAYLVLARLELKDNNPGAADADLERALTLEPGNPLAQSLKREMDSRAADKGRTVQQ